jgi:hypothetical protein
LARLREFLSKWKDAAATVQAFAIAVTTVGGGFWAVYSFSALQNAKRADLEVGQRTTEQAFTFVETAITVSQAAKQGQMLPVVIDVHLINHGSRPVLVDLRRESLGFAEVQGDSYPRRAASRLSSPIIYRLWPTKVVGGGYTILFPGSKRDLSYVFYVRRPGVYLADFEAPTSRRMNAQGIDSILKASGFDSTGFASMPTPTNPTLRTISASRFVEIK